MLAIEWHPREYLLIQLRYPRGQHRCLPVKQGMDVGHHQSQQTHSER